MSHRSFLDAAELPDNEGPDEDDCHGASALNHASAYEQIARGLRASRDRTGGERDAEIIRKLAIEGLLALARLRDDADSPCAVCKAVPCRCLIEASMLDEAALEVRALDEDGNVLDRLRVVVGEDGRLRV